MGKLIKKEITLCMHPTVPIMLLLSAMVFIPSYPYSVIFFYVAMSIFFTCLTGRENNDIAYSVMLPVPKRDVVKARFAFAVLAELTQIVLMIPLVILKNSAAAGINEAGLDANTALFGLAFIDYAIFNAVFFSGYYKNVKKVGASFVRASVAVFLFVAVEVTSTYAVPFVRDVLDTPDPQYTAQKLVFLALGAVIFALGTFLTYKRSARSFETQDI